MRWTVLALVVACRDNTTSNGNPPWLAEAKILVDGYDSTTDDCRSGVCAHNENTDLIVYQGATFLVHRTAESQVLGPNSSLRVYRSGDHGGHFDMIAIIPAETDRDLREPSFYVMPDGSLAIKAITRLPVTSTRDSFVDSVSVNTVSTDGGVTWSPFTAIGPETWSFWRVKGDATTGYFSAAYEDGDQSVVLFTSTDGQAWTMGAPIYTVSDDTPVETELVLSGTQMLALVRMDGTNDELLGNVGRLRTKVCSANAPFASFDCSGELDGVRLDGPVAFADGDRTFVVARKHFIEDADRKRTSLYELVGGDIVDHGDFPSAGDTAYAGVAPIAGHEFLVTYYSSHLADDPPWARAILEASDIWQATIDLSRL
jgi:hypothetical protein